MTMLIPCVGNRRLDVSVQEGRILMKIIVRDTVLAKLLLEPDAAVALGVAVQAALERMYHP